MFRGRIAVLCSVLLAILSFQIVRPVRAAENPDVQRRVALVIGIGDYRSLPKLANPHNDAKLIADRLSAAGFKLVGDGPQIDLDRDGFDSVLDQFSAIAAGADIAVVFYAGHGIQANDTNYLLPVDARAEKPRDLLWQAIDTIEMMKRLDESQARLKLLLLDACRNNPFPRGLRGLMTVGSDSGPVGTLGSRMRS